MMEPMRDMLLRQARELGALPCPCCGSPPYATCSIFYPRLGGQDGYGSAVCCSNEECNLHTAVNWKSSGGIEEAVRRWNRRTSEAVGGEGEA